ncbi:hypothetical protein jhhlp_001133 [Lomentospora prolificans]|uniref:Extracellular membrane protein CFEM domain-containing protein n=1 Tax=Lomentospora prolificans TaxID=41688 RepID=A0A2N3NH95_9PEZI|nr:hypothetical protein jhhlp_001133 [Lomentospora prolificans]
MRFTPVIVASIFAVAVSAQDATTSATTPASTSGLTTEQQKCINACDANDVNCLAHCTPVPSPNEDNLNKLHDCVGKCDQGDGSESATVAYGNCVQECIVENYYDPKQGTPNQPGAGSSSGSGSDSDSSSGSGSDSGDNSSGDSSKSGDATSTGSSADSTETPGAAAGLVASSSLGLFGLLAAVLAF